MIRVAIAGASGRMGRTLIQAVAEDGALQLGAAIEQPGAPSVGADAGEVAGVGALSVPIADSVADVIDDFETLINFTVPSATLAAVDVCHDAGRGLVIGTTGFDAAGLARIRAAAEAVPILMAPNMSIG
ncbi:MAG: 4-hydroxy-tetrahydrodipicolinate reductase, partial [Gammaproteobacteria bacterium]|nr:4-hydroxy-tetrahydrodipicolinate reductase [Gammaproteobacteria bacterium]